MRQLAALVVLAACGGRYHPPPAPHHAGEPAPLAVERAALPYAIVDGRSGRAVPEAQFWAAVTTARAVCAGEEHPNLHHHWAQWTIVSRLAAAPGRRALGLEQIQAPFQGVVDDFVAGAIDEPTFLSRVGWADRWGYPWSLYRPIVAAAKAQRWQIRALNAPSELVKRVSKVGVAGLEAVERAQLPELVLDDGRHRSWFDALMAEMGDHGGAHMPSPDNLYAAQVVWDESMAAGARAWLDGGDAIVILAGNGHCHDSAIVGRLRRRGAEPVLSVRPIIDDRNGNVAAALAEDSVDYLWIMTPP